MASSEPVSELEALIVAAMAGQEPGQEGSPGRSDAKILDAAVEVLGSHGEQNLTIDLVAEHARLSRMTVFRRFGSKQRLIDAVYERELRAVLRDVGEHAHRATTARERAVVVAARLVENAEKSPVVQWLVRVQPGYVVRLWREREPSGQTLGRIFVSGLLQDQGLADPLPPREADLVADAVVRLAMSLVLVPGGARQRGSGPLADDYIGEVVGRLFQG
ncbi:MAG: TetR/AcrR family transcriptional regulator [Segniliparus sp.]|uniref:TetR/AcrR family transcriptional regulator n=1 Tax=Segniliparus sp. TaxID=2804064 RepID=UPI003F305CC8